MTTVLIPVPTLGKASPTPAPSLQNATEMVPVRVGSIVIDGVALDPDQSLASVSFATYQRRPFQLPEIWDVNVPSGALRWAPDQGAAPAPAARIPLVRMRGTSDWTGPFISTAQSPAPTGFTFPTVTAIPPIPPPVPVPPTLYWIRIIVDQPGGSSPPVIGPQSNLVAFRRSDSTGMLRVPSPSELCAIELHDDGRATMFNFTGAAVTVKVDGSIALDPAPGQPVTASRLSVGSILATSMRTTTIAYTTKVP